MKAIANSIAVMYRGEVVRYGSKSTVLAPPFDAYTDLLLSSCGPWRSAGWKTRSRGPAHAEHGELRERERVGRERVISYFLS